MRIASYRLVSFCFLLLGFVLICNAWAANIQCFICRESINGRYWKLDKSTVCDKCYKKYPRCSYCGKMIPAGAKNLDGGRSACATCAATFVCDINTALNMLKEVMGFAETELGMTPRQDCTLNLVTRNAMMAAAGANVCGLAGSGKISMVNDLPRADFYATAAHEYGHLWQGARNPSFNNPDMREGFAQWVAAQWAKRKGFPEQLKDIERRSADAYSRGYKYFSTLTPQQALAVVCAPAPAAIVDSAIVPGKQVPKEVEEMFKEMAARAAERKAKAAAQATPKPTPTQTELMMKAAAALNVGLPPMNASSASVPMSKDAVSTRSLGRNDSKTQ